MTTVGPTFSQIRAQVASIKKKAPDAEVIGIHTAGQWTGARENRDGDQLYVVEQCDSPLALRVALREKQPEGAIKVLLTQLDYSSIDLDIRIRLARQRLWPIDSWQVIQTLFQAHAVDPRLTKKSWAADRLLEYLASGECPAAPGGFLDLDTVWSFLLDRGLGLGMARPDLPAIIRWSVEENNVSRFKSLSDDFRGACVTWLKEAAHPAVELVLQCVLMTARPDALSVGLAAQAIFNPAVSGKTDKAIVRLEERYLGGKRADRALCQRWGEAAREVVRFQITDPRQREALLRRSDSILKELGAEQYAFVSDVSLKAFDQRLSAFGEALKDALEDKNIEQLETTYKVVLEHDQAKRDVRRLERIEMAMRLVRWLKDGRERSAVEPSSFSQAVLKYLDEGSFVDWARLALRHGDAVAALSEAYMKLFRKCQAIQEKQAQYFATLLQDWTAAGSNDSDLIPVENCLSQVVAPLAQKSPVLLIVMDGMSPAVFNELICDITRRDWSLLTRRSHQKRLAGLATIPSVTEFSRASLLCGKLASGNSATERSCFSQHPELLATCRTGKSPLLFHKADLHGSEGALLPEIRSALASTDHRVVGVVINAVDDHLLKGEQIDTRWTCDAVRSLPTLLYEARVANRIVVIVSDHGHVLEFNSSCVSAEGGDRWRSANEQPQENEVRLTGHRVCTDSRTVVVPWSESVRYAIKKNGYHGGVNPQEMVIPIAVVAANEDVPEGWAETGLVVPAWWSTEQYQQLPVHEDVQLVSQTKSIPSSLLDWHEEDDPVSTTAEEMPAWIAELIACPVFHEQKKLAGRSFPKNENVFTQLLVALEKNGGKMTSPALARSLNYPPIRLGGLLAISQRVLNLDGYEVLGRDDESDTIELNIQLLQKQFQISRG